MLGVTALHCCLLTLLLKCRTFSTTALESDSARGTAASTAVASGSLQPLFTYFLVFPSCTSWLHGCPVLEHHHFTLKLWRAHSLHTLQFSAVWHTHMLVTSNAMLCDAVSSVYRCAGGTSTLMLTLLLPVACQCSGAQAANLQRYWCLLLEASCSAVCITTTRQVMLLSAFCCYE
jgi:hypothetical protein